MKTASTREVRRDFNRILEWVANGEEVTITKRREIVARLLPAARRKTAYAEMPDVSARLQKVFGRKVISDKAMRNYGRQSEQFLRAKRVEFNAVNPISIRIVGLLILAFCCCLSCLDINAQNTAGSAQLSSGMTTVPGVIRHNLHLPEIRVHDPWILAYAPTKTYYLYTSNNGRVTGVNRPGTMAYRSKDLYNWEGPLVVFQLPEGTWAANQPAWAPEVHEYKNHFYLFTTLHNADKIIATPPQVWRTNTMRGTVIAVGQSPEGPFTLLKTNGPVPPANFMTLDGTFYVDPAGRPWMVYAHEWIQKIDGTMEAVPLTDDLSDASGSPIYLFKGSDAPWLDEQGSASTRQNNYVTDGPEMFRTKDGHLLMLWSSYDTNGYVETVARSRSGEIQGPWEQLPPLVRRDSGHGMLFYTFDRQLMLVLHRPFNNARAKLYEVSDEGDHLRILRERTDLDGDQGMQ